MDLLADSRWSAPSTVTGFAQSPPNAVLMTFAQEELQRSQRARVFDLGCGAGRNAVPLARLGWTVVGTDLSWPMLCAETQLVVEFGRVGFSPDPGVPFREYNRPQPGALPTRTMPVTYEAAFRHES